jgi:predicted flap endonuclease-1-like 5' DNA nuclease
VRLAAKLTGWMIDIRSKKEIAKSKLEGMTAGLEGAAESEAAAADAEAPASEAALSDLDGVGPKVQEALIQAGYADVASIAAVTPEDLRKVAGIGEKTAQKIHASALQLSGNRQPSTAAEASTEAGIETPGDTAQQTDAPESGEGNQSDG